jgi:prevent-host-death family protein
MKTIGVFEAKTHLNQLLQRVAKGESIRITLRGVPVAKLVPDAAGEKEDKRELVAGIRQLRKGAVLGKTSIRKLIDEGRRY